jgi:hypothetical protein
MWASARPTLGHKLEEAALSDEQTQHSTHETVNADLVALQQQLKTITAERDRYAFEKSEIIVKANAFSKERDELRERLTAATGERDRLISELAEASKRLEESARQAAASAAEAARLRQALESGPSNDPLFVLQELASQQTQRLVAWTRSKIPADHPALPWFDKTIETITKLGQLAVKGACAFYVWAKPRVIEIYNLGRAQIEARLAKK